MSSNIFLEVQPLATCDSKRGLREYRLLEGQEMSIACGVTDEWPPIAIEPGLGCRPATIPDSAESPSAATFVQCGFTTLRRNNVLAINKINGKVFTARMILGRRPQPTTRRLLTLARWKCTRMHESGTAIF
jgi:hypothetical protein